MALQWTITAYGLTLAGFLMLSGRLGDIYGHKKLFIIGVMLFSLSSLMGGLAPSETVLFLARAAQGLGAVMASAAGLSILVTVFAEGKERNRARSIFAAVTGLGSASGMILGGVITATMGWRAVFEINVPIGLALSWLSIRHITNITRGERNRENKHLDILGAISITGGLMLLVYSLDLAQTIGFGSLQTLETLLLSILTLARLYFDRASLKDASYATWFSAKRFDLCSKRTCLASDGCICWNDIYFNKLFSARTRLLSFIYRHCISPYEYNIPNHFWIFVSTVGHPLWRQAYLNFGDDFADNRLSASFADIYCRQLLWSIVFTNDFDRTWNWIWLYCDQHSRTHGN